VFTSARLAHTKQMLLAWRQRCLLVAPRAGEPSPGAGRSAAGTTASRHRDDDG